MALPHHAIHTNLDSKTSYLHYRNIAIRMNRMHVLIKKKKGTREFHNIFLNTNLNIDCKM